MIDQVRNLTPVEVLAILAKRLEDRAAALERVRLDGYSVTIEELRRFAGMVRKAQQYVGETLGG